MGIRERILERFAIQAEKARKEVELSEVKSRLRSVEREIAEWLEDNDCQAFKTEEGPSVSAGSKLRVSVSKERLPEFLEYLRGNGFEGVIKETVHHATMSAVVKEMQEAGISIPDYVNMYDEPSPSFRSNGYQVKDKGVNHGRA